MASGLASDGQQAVRAAVTLRLDVIVMDIQMPALSGVAATREIARAAPDVAVLMLTMFDDDSVFAAMRAGARSRYQTGARPSSARGTAASAAALADPWPTADGHARPHCPVFLASRRAPGARRADCLPGIGYCRWSGRPSRALPIESTSRPYSNLPSPPLSDLPRLLYLAPSGGSGLPSSPLRELRPRANVGVDPR